MSGRSEKVSRRHIVGTGVSALLGFLTGARTSEAQQPKASEQPIEYGRIVAYIHKLHSTKILRDGTSREIMHLLQTGDVLGDETTGQRPIVPRFDSRFGKMLYPQVSKEYKSARDTTGWPTLRISFPTRVKDSKETRSVLIPTMSLRISEVELLVPAYFLRSIYGLEDIRGRGGLNSNLNLGTFRLQLKGNDVNAPITDIRRLREISIKDGTYAVALGKTKWGKESPNFDIETGATYLTGFLLRLSDKPRLRELVEKFVRRNFANDADEFLRVLNNSYVMVGDRHEFRGLTERVDENERFAMPVYTSNGKSFGLAGVLHTIGYITEDGSKIESGKAFAPLYFVHDISTIRHSILNGGNGR